MKGAVVPSENQIGETSGTKTTTEQVWAKLVSSDSRYPDIEIRSTFTAISSEITSTSSDKHEWCHIQRNSDLFSATIRNKGSNTIVVDGTSIKREDALNIKCGSEIVTGHLMYQFELMAVPEKSCQKKLKISLDVEHTKCSICLNVWHDVVTVAPCFHSFCNGCFSEWMRRSQDKHSDILCPQCRGFVQFAGRNHFLHNIEEDILQADASSRRSKEELAVLDSYASIKSNIVINNGKMNSRKRSRSPVYVESDDSNFDSEEIEHPCPQCGTELSGFQCNPSTIHTQCQSCGGMMPSRSDINTPQLCLGCDQAFCGAYWHAQRISEIQNSVYPVCSQDTFKPILEHRLSRIPSTAHERNQYEQSITERCLQQMGRTIQDVVSEWVRKMDGREIDRTRMPLNHAEMITSGTYLCNACYEKLVSFLLYWFRITLPNHLLPSDVSNRENCWYGYSCRTQHHSAAHASKRNHVCRPTRGSQL